MEIKKTTDFIQVDPLVQERELRCLKENVMNSVEEAFSHSWVPGKIGGMGRHTVETHFENQASKKISKRGIELGIHRTKIETAPHNPKYTKH